MGSNMTGDDDTRPEDEPWLTSTEAARILHVSTKTVDRWADRGLIPCIVTLGGHRRFTRQAVAEAKARMEGGPGEGDPGEHPE